MLEEDREGLLPREPNNTHNPDAVSLRRLMSGCGSLAQLAIPASMALLKKAENPLNPAVRNRTYIHVFLYMLCVTLVNSNNNRGFHAFSQQQEMLEEDINRQDRNIVFYGLRFRRDWLYQDMLYAIVALLPAYALNGSLNDPHNRVLEGYNPDSNYYSRLNLNDSEKVRSLAFIMRSTLLTIEVLFVIYASLSANMGKMYREARLRIDSITNDRIEQKILLRMQDEATRIRLRDRLLKISIAIALPIASFLLIVNTMFKVTAPRKKLCWDTSPCDNIQPSFLDPHTFFFTFLFILCKDFGKTHAEKVQHELVITLVAVVFPLVYLTANAILQCTPFSSIYGGMLWGSLAADYAVEIVTSEFHKFCASLESILIKDFNEYRNSREIDRNPRVEQKENFKQIEESFLDFCNAQQGESTSDYQQGESTNVYQQVIDDTGMPLNRQTVSKLDTLSFWKLLVPTGWQASAASPCLRGHAKKLFLVLSLVAMGVGVYNALPPQASASPDQPTRSPTRQPTPGEVVMPLAMQIGLLGPGGTGASYQQRGIRVFINSTGGLIWACDSKSPGCIGLAPEIGAQGVVDGQPIVVVRHVEVPKCENAQQFACIGRGLFELQQNGESTGEEGQLSFIPAGVPQKVNENEDVYTPVHPLGPVCQLPPDACQSLSWPVVKGL